MGGEKEPRNLVWGECCNGWRHFDCLGLIDLALDYASPIGKKEFRTVEMWASPKNSVRGKRMTKEDAILDGDLVSNADYSHIGIVYLEGESAYVVQAEQTSIGVTTGALYDPGDSKSWKGGRWRVPDSMFLPDEEVTPNFPSSACEPTPNVPSRDSMLPGNAPGPIVHPSVYE